MVTRSILALVSLSLSLLPTALASVLAVDYGTDWTKASLMKPGIPFDVLLGKDSKRKIHASVGWNREDRLFSTDAFNIATRFPQDSFPSLKHIVGSQYGSNKTWYYSQVGQGVVLETERGTVALERTNNGGTKWTVEELIAMQLAHIRSLAEDAANERVTDLVLTVPAFFSHAQRQALLDAAEIAGLKPLALLNDGSAVALNYAMTRSFPGKENHIIFDAGAGSIRATVASFHSPDAKPASEAKKTSKSKSPSKESVNIDILGYGYDTTASGNELTRRLRDGFVEQFEIKHGFSISRNGRARARLWKEAERVKGILSANADSRSTVESLANDVDFKTTTSRVEFETMAADLKARFARPIVDALENSGLKWENITSVILMGGHSRVPMIQAAVRELVGETMISQNINTDEAAVLGGAFYGATLSRQFKTKKIKLQDISIHDLQVSYEADGKSGKRTINTLVFPKKSKLGVKKTLSFKRKEDFVLHFLYNTPADTPEFPQKILDVDISNVTHAVANLTSRGAQDAVVKITLQLNDNGLVSISDAFAFGEVKDDSLTGKLKNLFGGGTSSSSSSAEPSGSAPVSSSSSAPAPSETPASTSDEKKAGKNKVPVIVATSHLSTRPLTTIEKNKSRARLIALDAAERTQVEREEAVNLLEGHIYRLRDILAEAEHGETVFKEFSTEEERIALRTLLEETAEWLLTIDADVTTSTLRVKRAALEALEVPIQGRHKEFEAIPAAIKDLHQAIEVARLFYTSALGEKVPHPQKPVEAGEDVETSSAEGPGPTARYTPEELEEVNAAIEEVQKWVNERIVQVAGSPKNVEVPFRAAEIDQKGIQLQRKVLRLSNRPKPAPKPKKKGGNGTTASESSTATSSSRSEETPNKRDEL